VAYNTAFLLKYTSIGYLVTDIDKKYDKDVMRELKAIDHTIKLRVLY